MFNQTAFRNDYVAGGGTDFTFTFPIYSEDDIRVLNATIEATKNVDYTVHAPGGAPFSSLGAASLPSEGFIRFLVAPTTNNSINLIPTQPLSQNSDYTSEALPSTRFEQDIDKLVMMARMIREAQARGIRLKPSSLFEALQIDDPVADGFLKWKADLSGIEVGTPVTIAAADVITTLGDLIQGGTGGAPERLAKVNNGVLVIDVATGKAKWLAPGSNNTVLTIVAGVPTYQAPAAVNLTKGGDIASASSLNVGAGTEFYFHVTGTTTITGITTRAAGTLLALEFDGSLQITHNASSLIMANGVNHQTTAGEILYFVSEGSGNWRHVHSKIIRAISIILSSTLQVGTNPASTGALNIPNNASLKARNAANSGDLDVIFLDGSNRVVIGNTGAIIAKGAVRCDVESTGRLVLPVGADKWAV